jgi:hypothetical protein
VIETERIDFAQRLSSEKLLHTIREVDLKKWITPGVRPYTAVNING